MCPQPPGFIYMQAAFEKLGSVAQQTLGLTPASNPKGWVQVQSEDFSSEVASLAHMEQSVLTMQGDLVKFWLPAPVLLAPHKHYMISALVHSGVRSLCTPATRLPYVLLHKGPACAATWGSSHCALAGCGLGSVQADSHADQVRLLCLGQTAAAEV